MTENPRPESASDVVIRRVREIRKVRGLSAAALAAACAKAGHPQLTESVIANIESGRRQQGVTVDELLAFTEALDVPLAMLLWPILEPAGQKSTLVFASPQERADFMELVNRLMAQVPLADQGPATDSLTVDQEKGE
jgi:transcriptional regulator with XRE-family HTH domain